jgi:hypothetical protein
MIILVLPNIANADGKDVSSMISLDVRLTPLANQLEIEFIVQNKSDENIQLEFPTSKMYDFSIFDENRKEVFRFSKGKFYLQAFQYVNIKSGEEKTWKMSWDYRNHGKRIKPGNYSIVAELLPIKLNGISVPKHWLSKQNFLVPPLSNIQIKGEAGVYNVTGNGDPSDGNFYFTVDDGHLLIVDKTTIKMLGDTNEFSIHLNIPKNMITNNRSLIFALYNQKDQVIFVQDLKK